MFELLRTTTIHNDNHLDTEYRFHG